jgi:hypothetical protein
MLRDPATKSYAFIPNQKYGTCHHLNNSHNTSKHYTPNITTRLKKVINLAIKSGGPLKRSDSSSPKSGGQSGGRSQAERRTRLVKVRGATPGLKRDVV